MSFLCRNLCKIFHCFFTSLVKFAWQLKDACFFSILSFFTGLRDETWIWMRRLRRSIFFLRFSGNFAMKMVRLLKAGSVLTPLPSHCGISQFHTPDHETVLSLQPAPFCLLLLDLHRSRLSHSQFNFLYLLFIDLNINNLLFFCSFFFPVFYFLYCRSIASFFVEKLSFYCFIDLHSLVSKLLNKEKKKLE